MKFYAFAATTALVLAAATAACGQIVTITYTGYVEAGSTDDSLDLFGGGSLVGDAFTAVYTINSLEGSLLTDNSTYSIFTNGGSPSGISERLTINGFSVEFAGGSSGPNETYRLDGFNNPSLNSVFGLGPGLLYGSLSSITESSPYVFGSNYLFSTDPITSSYDYAAPWQHPRLSTDASVGVLDDGPESIALYDTSVQVTDLVPELSAWALTLLGFGAIGAALRMDLGRRTAA
ncbi:MAG: hypothetical protein ACREEB_10345 [Caulobacteraceae bacterium]